MFHFNTERIKIFADRVLITSKFDFSTLSKCNAFDIYLNQLRDNTSEWKRKYS